MAEPDDGTPLARLAPPLLLLLAVGLIALVVRFGWTTAYEQAALDAMIPPPWLVGPARAISMLGGTVVRVALAGIACLILLLRRRWPVGLVLALVVLGGAAFNSLLKLLVARPRPDLLEHLDHVTNASFPSGHSAGAVATYGAIALLAHDRRWLAAAMLLAGLIGVSRVMLAVHWPSDVLAGWCAGAAWLLLWRDRLVRAAQG